MPLGKTRDKILSGLSRARGRAHRYTLWRWAIAIVFTLLIAALPLLDVLRFDFWRGRHMWLGEELGLVEVAKRFAFPFLAVNILIVVVSRFLGRYLCGFVCPYGALARLSEWARFRGKTSAQRLSGWLALFVVCLLLSAIVFVFWVDPRVFLEGSPVAITVASVFLGGMTLSFFGCLFWLGQRFCREWCPSGVYFAVLAQNTLNGIEFAHPETCTECKACDKVCPMDLKPRELSGGAYRGGTGFYPQPLSNFALCIRCGDCVVACEDVNEARRDGPASLRMGWLPEGARDAVDRTQPAADELEGGGWQVGAGAGAPGPAADEEER